jgi:hypothetical protein
MTTVAEVNESVIDDLAVDGLNVFQNAIQRAGLVFSEELLKDWSTSVIKNDDVLAVEWQFQMYGRYKDMKRITGYMPPVEAMIEYVEKIGVDKFAWVPGYTSMDKVPTEAAASRIAWGLAKYRASVKTIRRSGSGWYNENVMKLVNKARYNIRKKTAEWVALQAVETIESA